MRYATIWGVFGKGGGESATPWWRRPKPGTPKGKEIFRTIWGYVDMRNTQPRNLRPAAPLLRWGRECFNTIWGKFGRGQPNFHGRKKGRRYWHGFEMEAETIWGVFPMYRQSRLGTTLNCIRQENCLRNDDRSFVEEENPSFENVVRAYEEDR